MWSVIDQLYVHCNVHCTHNISGFLINLIWFFLDRFIIFYISKIERIINFTLDHKTWSIFTNSLSEVFGRTKFNKKDLEILFYLR